MSRPGLFVPVLGLLSLGLAAVAVAVVWPAFDGLYGQDAYWYFEYALGPLDAALRQRGLPPAFFWPPGFPLVIWLASTAVGASPLAGQLVTLVAGALVPVLSALVAWELFVAEPASVERVGGAGLEVRPPVMQEESLRRWLPLLVGIAVAAEAQLWQSSLVVMSDTPGLAAGTAGVWLTARWGRTLRTRDLLLAAGLMAFAVLTRWAYALVAIPVTLFTLGCLWSVACGARPGLRRDSHADATGGGPAEGLAQPSAAGPAQPSAAGPAQPSAADGVAQPWWALRQALFAAVVVGGVLLPIWVHAALDLLMNESSTGTPFAGSLSVYGWSPLNAVRRTFTTTDGQLAYRLPNGLYYALTPAHWYFFTPLLAPFLLPGAWTLWRLRDARRLWLVAGWAGAVIGFHAGAAWQNFRFTLVYLPPLGLVLGLGILTTWRWLNERARLDARPIATALLAAYVLVGFATMAWGGVRLTGFFVDRKQADLRTVAWVEALTPEDARLLSFDLTFTLQRYGARETRHLFYETGESVRDLLATGRPTFVVLEPDAFLGQWGEHPAGETFLRLREDRGLTELGRDREYVLYRVGDGS